MVTKDGDTAPSAKPNKNRTVAKPAKLVGAARHMHMMPQMILFTEVSSYFKSSRVVFEDSYTVPPTNLVRCSFDMR
jgi:hypothetical protein